MDAQPDTDRALIEVRGLRKEYRMGDHVVPALVDLDVDIRQGEFVAIMGPSGSGKSTCMHILGCLDRPTAGTYVLDGEDVSALGADALADIRNSKVGFVFQSFNLLGRASALANVELPMMYGHAPRRERREAAEAALTAVGLGERMHHLPTQLSGGQMQRVAIARAIVNQPEMLLADEPTGALDTRTGFEIMALFQQLNKDGITLLIVTHEPEIAAFAQRVLHFRDGRLVGDETVEEPRSAQALLDEGVGARPEAEATT
jgi:putative ABC transport system ATP-binding protein